MRLIVYGKLKFTSLSLEYRKGFISYIKNALEYSDKDLFDTLYSDKNTGMKGFASAFLMQVNQFENNAFHLNSNDIKIIFTTFDVEMGIRMYNALLSQIGIKYPIFENEFEATSVKISKTQMIRNNYMDIKFLSPLLVRSVKNSHDYHRLESEFFQEDLLRNTKEQMVRMNLCKPTDDLEFALIPISPKRVVIKHYNQYIDGYVGNFRLIGDPVVLNYLYESGLGSRKSAGFGLFDRV